MGRVINKKNEKHSTFQKLAYHNPTKKDEVPENCTFIERTGWDTPMLEKTSEKFFQKEFENCKIFFLENEIKFFGPIFLDM